MTLKSGALIVLGVVGFAGVSLPQSVGPWKFLDLNTGLPVVVGVARDGVDGQPGARGPQGIQGIQGPQGPAGAAGGGSLPQRHTLSGAERTSPGAITLAVGVPGKVVIFESGAITAGPGEFAYATVITGDGPTCATGQAQLQTKAPISIFGSSFLGRAPAPVGKSVCVSFTLPATLDGGFTYSIQ